MCDILLSKIYEILDRTDMHFDTIMKIFVVIITPMLNRKIFKEGIYNLPNIMRKTLPFITANDFR